ncbi:MAG: M14 family metallopeptidase [Candidatus Limnocylindrales bacterium]
MTRRRSSIAVLFSLALLAALPAHAGAFVYAFPDGYGDYHTYTEMVADLQAVADAHPDIVSLSPYGTSYEGRTLWKLKISDNAGTDEDEPEVLISAMQHAKEHLGLEQALAIIHWLTDDYGEPGHQRTTDIVNTREIWVLPEINPDGAEFDIRGGHFHNWRKNRQPNEGSEFIGTDLNRNYGFHWGCCGGASANPASIVYRGPAKWSAPETSWARDFVRSRRVDGDQQIVYALSLHQHAEKILYPMGYTTEAVPVGVDAHDHLLLKRTAQHMAMLNGYQAQQAARWYISSGTGGDWAYARQGIYAYTFELPPVASPTGGYLPNEEILPAVENNRGAILWLIEQAECPAEVLGETCDNGVARPSTGAPAAVGRATVV